MKDLLIGVLLFYQDIIFFSRNGHTKTTGDNIIQAPDGQGCPRCGGFVYHADQVFSKGELRIFFRIFY